MIRVTGSRVVIVDGRPPLLEVRFTGGDGGRPLDELHAYGLDPMTAFELGHSLATMAMQLQPTLVDELRRRMAELNGAL